LTGTVSRNPDLLLTVTVGAVLRPELITGCGGSGYEFGDDVLKFPSASRGNPAAAGFAETLSSRAFAFSLACSIVIQVSEVVALHSKSDSVPAHPVKSKALPRGINSINSFMIFPVVNQLCLKINLYFAFAKIASAVPFPGICFS
jgi:hypothetical protein